MIRRHHSPSQSYVTSEDDLDALVRGIKRLVLHRGFDRTEIESPLLKRLTPLRSAFGTVFSEADLRKRLEAAQLDANALSYLLRTAESELDYARLRLT